MIQAKKCLDAKINLILDQVRKTKNLPEDKRSFLHFEYIDELKEEILELRRAKIILALFSVKDLTELE